VGFCEAFIKHKDTKKDLKIMVHPPNEYLILVGISTYMSNLQDMEDRMRQDMQDIYYLFFYHSNVSFLMSSYHANPAACDPVYLVILEDCLHAIFVSRCSFGDKTKIIAYFSTAKSQLFRTLSINLFLCN
jgi:hypothetical protein